MPFHQTGLNLWLVSSVIDLCPARLRWPGDENFGAHRMSENLERAVVWRSHLFDGTEHCGLWRTAQGWELRGAVVGVQKDQPMLAYYEVYCDSDWLTRRVQIYGTIGKEAKILALTVEDRGVWRGSGQDLSDLNGCDDVDLAVTPATNTLPIKRLNLQIGQSAAVVAAWIRFPELIVQPLSQRYTRIDGNTYRYESDTGFSAEIGVDDLGLVTTYSGGWERIAAL